MPTFTPLGPAKKKSPVAYISNSGNLIIHQPTNHRPNRSIRIDATPSHDGQVVITEVDYFDPDRTSNFAVFYLGDQLTITF